MKRLIGVLLSLCIIALSACGQENISSDEPLTIHAAQGNAIETLDVAKTTNQYIGAVNIFDRLFETVLQEDGTTKIEKSLCDDYTVSKDGLTYKFTLKSDIVFSNGNPLTSGDVQYTFERLLSIGMVNDDIPWEVAGAEEFADGKTERLEGFKTTDDLNFEITLSAPNAGFIAELSSGAMSIVDAETTENAQNFGINPEETIGTGPYKIEEFVGDDHLTLVYNDKYWGAEPDVKRFILHIIPDITTMEMSFKKGEINILCLELLDPEIAEGYRKDYSDRLFESYQLGINYLAMNENNEYLSDVNVRKAINKAIDLDYIIENVLNNAAVAQQGIIPKGVWGYDKDLVTRTYDPEGAKALLEESGYAPDEISFEISSDNEQSEIDKLVIQCIIQNLRDVGINVHEEIYEYNTWMEKRVSGEIDSFMGIWLMDYNDPGNIMNTFFGSEELTKSRSINYKNTEVMNRVAAAKNIVDDDVRMTEYRELERIIAGDDAAWVPLYSTKVSYCVSDTIESMKPHWAGYVAVFNVKDIVLK